jgi:hypothetical protein
MHGEVRKVTLSFCVKKLRVRELTYDSFKLLNAEFTFDVDVPNVPCDINGALYFGEMEATGNTNDLNLAGAAYGTG